MFFLRKEWRDAEDGIEMVVLHWTVTRQEQQPNWKRAHATTVMNPQPGTYPVIRSCQLWVLPPFPRTQLLTINAETYSRFLLHSFCEVIQRGRAGNTEVTIQEIRAETVTYRDMTGDYTHALLYYSLDDLAQGNRTSMCVDGLPTRYQDPPVLPEHTASHKEYRLQAKRSQLVAQLPLPRIFRGQIWGPVGARAFYSVYLSQRWTYNPFAESGLWLLQDGRPREVRI
jgi:hypothetical protein